MTNTTQTTTTTRDGLTDGQRQAIADATAADLLAEADLTADEGGAYGEAVRAEILRRLERPALPLETAADAATASMALHWYAARCETEAAEARHAEAAWADSGRLEEAAEWVAEADRWHAARDRARSLGATLRPILDALAAAEAGR